MLNTNSIAVATFPLQDGSPIYAGPAAIAGVPGTAAEIRLDFEATEGSIRAAAHYDLAHSPVQHTVSALLLVWDGAELIADEAGELGTALGSPGTRRATRVAA